MACRLTSELGSSFIHWLAANVSLAAASASSSPMNGLKMQKKTFQRLCGRRRIFNQVQCPYRKVGPTQAVSVLSISCKIRSCSVTHSMVSFSAMIVVDESACLCSHGDESSIGLWGALWADGCFNMVCDAMFLL